MKRIFCAASAAVILLTGCGKSAVTATRDVFAMDTYMSLRAHGNAPDAALDEAVNEIHRLEELLSVTAENSDISRINDSGGEPVTVHPDTSAIIEKAVEIGDETGGCLDISVYPVLREWGFTTGSYKVPDRELLDELLKNVDYRQIGIDGNSVTVPPEYQLDLGALAKGFTSDRVMEIFRENGVRSAIVSLGGNVQTLGTKPDGSPWKVAVVDPFAPDRTMAVIAVTDRAVITSGNYERYFMEDDGRRYHHIIDPQTGSPAENGLVSVTVIGSSGLECDALSTALFVAGAEKAAKYWRSRDDLDMILVTADRQIYYTPGLADTFENVSEMPAEQLKR